MTRTSITILPDEDATPAELMDGIFLQGRPFQLAEDTLLAELLDDDVPAPTPILDAWF